MKKSYHPSGGGRMKKRAQKPGGGPKQLTGKGVYVTKPGVPRKKSGRGR